MQTDKLIALNSFHAPGFGELVPGEGSCKSIHGTADKKSVFISFNSGETMVTFPTKIGVPAYYPVRDLKVPKKISAVLMDLDGTSVHSEHFWMWVIQSVTAELLGQPFFKLEKEDLPHVSGFSVSEHLQYCISKYCQDKKSATLEHARDIYFRIVHRELQNVLQGKPVVEPAFEPAPQLKELLLFLKEKKIKIGLVSSGLEEKSIPEIKAAFDKLEMGNPLEFYDAVVTAGQSVKRGHAGTLGELEPKPHPWLYLEALHVLNVPKDEVLGIEDSGAGILSLVAGQVPAVGLGGGNVESGGEKSLCNLYFDALPGFFQWLKGVV